jgi:toxin ParE1/3/4
MGTVELSNRAAADLLDIYLHGIRQFGPNQADIYLDGLDRCFLLIADNPKMGRRADDVGEGLRRHEHQSHVIFYEPTATGIFVVAVLHGRQLPDLIDP